jgi:ornithine carbamoyltransferase
VVGARRFRFGGAASKLLRSNANVFGGVAVQHYLAMTDATREELARLLVLSAEIKAEPARFSDALGGRNIGLLFMKPSTRTRISFEVGINQLGGHAVVLSSAELQLGRGETVSDTARVLSRYLDGLMARVFGHELLEELAAAGSIPIINGLSDLLHPCQGLCDYFSMKEHFGGELAGRKLAYVGDGNNMAHSLLLGGAMLGVHVSVASPEGYEVSHAVLERARAIGQETGARLEAGRAPEEAVEGADVVYTDVWASMGQEAEREKRLKAFVGYQVDLPLFEQAHPEAIFMHCLPAHRGEEVAAEVIDHPRSIVFDQAENRLHTQKALMVTLLGER